MGDEQPISEFNAALANAYNAHDLRVGIQRAMVLEDHKTQKKYLKCLSLELIAWYSKGNNEDKIKKLKDFMYKVENPKIKKLLLIKLLNDWTEIVLTNSYEVWFGLEKDKVGSLFS